MAQLSMISGDNILNKILNTHVSDGCGDADLNPLLRLVEDILSPCNTVEAPSQSQSEGNAVVLGQLSSVIDRISYEISYKALSKANPESTTMTIFEMIRDYSWDVKLVMSMAAFALNYGNFLLLNQTHSSIRIARSIALIRNLPAGIEQSVNPLKELMEVMINVARCVVEFKTLPAAYVSWEAPEFRTVMDHFRVAAYFTVRSVVACSTHITSLTHTSSQTICNSPGALTTQIISMTADSKSQFASFELAGWTQQLVKLHAILMERLEACRILIEEKRSEDFYQMLVKLFEASQPDKLKILEALFCIDGGDRRQPLINCSTGTRAGIDVLSKENVLLLISGLQISQVELVNLRAVYEEYAITHEVVWIPLMDEWAESTKAQWNEKKGWMPWYTVCQPESINKMVIRFVKEKWQFETKPMIAVLGPDGKLVCRDAFHLVQVWGSGAYPFHSSKLDGLWGKVNWSLEFLIQTIEPPTSTVWDWVREEKNLILLCGGDKFDAVKDIKRIVSEAGGKLPDVASIEVIYAGKSSKLEQVENVVRQISDQKIGFCLGSVNGREMFWKRLESMLVSKIQHGKVEESDRVLYELQKLLNYDKDKEWTMLCRGSNIIASGPGSSIADALNKYDIWGHKVDSDGFEKAFKDYLHGLFGGHRPDCIIELPFTIPGAANLPMKCPECGCIMKKCITFTCNHEAPKTITVSTTSTTTTTTTSTTATTTSG